jgi:hypothetical protein
MAKGDKSIVQQGEDWVANKAQSVKDFAKKDIDAWKAILSSSPDTTADSSSQDTSSSPDMGPNGSVWKSGHKKGGVIKTAIVRGHGIESRGKTKGRYL